MRTSISFGAPKREEGTDHDSEVVHVRHVPRRLVHPEHPPKVVILSHKKRRVIGEQG